MRTLRQAGQRDWTSSDSTEHISLGCRQRIADATEMMAAATEKMAIHHDRLIRDLAWYKEQYNNARANLQYQGRSHSSLKGQITKLRNKNQVMAQPNEWTEQDALLELINLKFQSGNDIPFEKRHALGYQLPGGRKWYIPASSLVNLSQKRNNVFRLSLQVGNIGNTLCRSSDPRTARIGGLISERQTEKEFDALLARKTVAKHRNTTTG